MDFYKNEIINLAHIDFVEYNNLKRYYNLDNFESLDELNLVELKDLYLDLKANITLKEGKKLTPSLKTKLINKLPYLRAFIHCCSPLLFLLSLPHLIYIASYMTSVLLHGVDLVDYMHNFLLSCILSSCLNESDYEGLDIEKENYNKLTTKKEAMGILISNLILIAFYIITIYFVFYSYYLMLFRNS